MRRIVPQILFIVLFRFAADINLDPKNVRVSRPGNKNFSLKQRTGTDTTVRAQLKYNVVLYVCEILGFKITV